MSDKKEKDYRKVIKDLEVLPHQLLMVGNSLKSDVLPIVKLGAKAVHIPYHTTWVHEDVKEEEASDFVYLTLKNIKELLAFFKCYLKTILVTLHQNNNHGKHKKFKKTD